MGYKSFESEEKDKVATLLNGMTFVRGVGGAALGVGMAVSNLDPTFTLTSAAALAATDLEGTVYTLTKPFQRVQRALRIIPSIKGRILDPVADKVFGVSVFVGGLVNGSIPTIPGALILGAEAATAAATVATTNENHTPAVSRVGKNGFVARCVAGGSYLAASAVGSGEAHDALTYAGHASAGIAVVLGGLSCMDIISQSRNTSTLDPTI